MAATITMLMILSSQVINFKQPNLGLTQESLRIVTARVLVLSSQVINSKQPNLGLMQESLRMVIARVLVVLSGSFTSQIEPGPTLT